MTTNPTTPKRWRPRFSVRTLVILVTLVCCYAACWGPTKTRGVADVEEATQEISFRLMLQGASPEEIEDIFRDDCTCLPLIVRMPRHDDPAGGYHYYFWFFGYVAKLPYERELTIRERIDRKEATIAELRAEIRRVKQELSRSPTVFRFQIRSEAILPSGRD